MKKKILISIGILIIAVLILGCIEQQTPPSEKLISEKEEAKQRLSQVKVAVLYENVTDGVLIGRSIDETIKILKETNTDFIFRGFWKWMPVVESPDDIPPELLELAEGKNLTPNQVSESVRRSGHYYQELKRWIFAIKKEMPDVIFCGAIPAQTLGRIEWNPITGKVYTTEETWQMALDPQKWQIQHNGKPITKEEFQKWFYGIHPYGGKLEEEYNWQKVPAYFPDITNPDFQNLFLDIIKKQIDSGVDVIWIDMLYHQAARLAQITGDVNHPAVRESIEAASKIVDEIHKYGYSKGKYIYVGSWDGPFVEAGVRANIEFPYSPPNLDFVTVSPNNKEILDKKLDKTRWDKVLPAIKEVYGNVPVFAFIDWSFDESQMVMFSQKLSKEEQREVLKIFDESFAKMGINFIYPVHGGYLGRGEITTRLAFGKYRIYDSLAPEFDTYDTIKELAQSKKKRDITSNVAYEYKETYSNLEKILNDFDTYLNSNWNGEKYNVSFGANLLPANLHAGEDMLDEEYYTKTIAYLDALKLLGVKEIHIDVGYPLFSSDYPRSNEYLEFYKRIVGEIKKKGLKLQVDFEFATPNYYYNVSYEGFTKEKVKETVLKYSQLICREFQPDTYTIIGEPTTWNQRIGLELTVEDWTEILNYVLNNLNCSGTLLGADGGTWNEEFIKSFAANTSVDFIDVHIYGVQENHLYKAIELFEYAKFHGKKVAIGEAWLHYSPKSGEAKWRYSDVFSFWEPLDAKFMRILVKLAHYQKIEFVDPFFTNYFFGYLDYNEVMKNKENYLPPQKGLKIALEKAMENAEKGIFTKTGLAYKEAISSGRIVWTKEDYAIHFINERIYGMTKEDFEAVLSNKTMREVLGRWFSHKDNFIQKKYYVIKKNEGKLLPEETMKAEEVYKNYNYVKNILQSNWQEGKNIDTLYSAFQNYLKSLKDFIFLLQELDEKYLSPEYDYYIEKYTPKEYNPMEFGATALSVCYQSIKLSDKERIRNEIDIFSDAGVDYIRIDIADKDSYSKEDLEKIDFAVKRIRENNKKLWIVPWGSIDKNSVEQKLDGKLTVSEWQEMIKKQLQEIAEYNPEYIEIVVEPFSWWERWGTVEETEPDEWLQAIENVAKKARELFPSSKIVVGVAGWEVDRKLKTGEPFAAGLFRIKEIDIIGLNFYEGSGTGGFEKTFGKLLDDYWKPETGKDIYIAETWWDGATLPGTYYDNLAEKQIISVTYWAQLRKLGGITLFFTSHLYTSDEYKPTPIFYIYKNVIEEVRNNTR